ncbi:MAG: Cof-type HAD-IIB family hydrolase [Lachnospiraceae bacterium]
MNDIKMLVLDIDGTLTNSRKEITEETKKAIKSIQERGHKVMLASGRPTPGMRRYEEELELEKYGGYLLSFNGGRIINCRTGEIVYQKMFPSVLIPKLYHFAKQNDCGLITYYGDKIILGTRMDDYVALESRINGMKVQTVDDFLSFVDFDVNKMLMTAPPDKAEEYEKQLSQKYGDIISVYRSEPFFIELMPKGVDKATSIDRMLSTVGMTRENTICCGDGFNDMTMIEYAGVGVAMANAQEKVKEKADYITKSNDEDGIVQVIDEFIL